jgi:hypothetical protein
MKFAHFCCLSKYFDYKVLPQRESCHQAARVMSAAEIEEHCVLCAILVSEKCYIDGYSDVTEAMQAGILQNRSTAFGAGSVSRRVARHRRTFSIALRLPNCVADAQ